MIKTQLPQILQKNFAAHPAKPIEAIFELSFKEMQEFLIKSWIDVTLSGATTVCCLMVGEHLYTANLGDSRAIFCRKLESKWEIEQLSQDHKPNLPSEKKRIVAAGGKVQKLRDPRLGWVGPPRVWQRNGLIPGLAMSRSFGDLMAAEVGNPYFQPNARRDCETLDDPFID